MLISKLLPAIGFPSTDVGAGGGTGGGGGGGTGGTGGGGGPPSAGITGGLSYWFNGLPLGLKASSAPIGSVKYWFNGTPSPTGLR